jgi:hypothetical protein
LNKNLTALLLIVCALLLTGVNVYSQDPTMAPAKTTQVTAQETLDNQVAMLREDLRSAKKQIVAANLPLTDTEATKFWPVYDRYIAAASKQYDAKVALIKEYADNYSNLTDAQATSLLKRSIAGDDALNRLRLQWLPEFDKVIPAKKTAMFMQIDRRLGLLIDLQLASEIPLVKP